MNIVSKFFNLILVLIILTNCSLNNQSKFWSKSKKIKKEKIERKEIFKKNIVYEKEFNAGLKIKINEKSKKKSFVSNLTNNNGIVNFNGSLNKISKYKFAKISQFNQYQPDLLITKNNTIIFFDDKGTILNFNEDSELVWRLNVYKKSDKKHKPILYFASNKNTLIVADNIANYYAVNINDGKLIWFKKNTSPFNSQIKIYKDKIFVVDFENILRCYSIKDGKELWKYKTEKSLIKSQQKLSVIINNKKNNIFFLNSLGDLTSLNLDTGSLIWQTPTQSTDIYENSFLLKNSDLIYANNSIYFSNNKNEFFAINEKTGVMKWKQNINSNLRPTFADNLIFTISLEGYLTLLDPRNGNILRMTNIFDRIKKSKIKNIKPTGFVVSQKKIYVSLNNGKLITVDLESGKSEDILKLSSEKISRPHVLNNNMYITRDNAILKIY